MIDLVVLNSHPPSYLQELNDKIRSAIFAASDPGFIDAPGGVFVRRMDQLTAEQLLMVRATARVHVPCQGQALSRLLVTALPDESVDEELEDISPRLRAPARSDSRMARVVRRIGATLPSLLAPLATESGFRPSRIHARGRNGALALDNGYGGISPDGDYIIRVSGDRVPPAPWANVIANPFGGFMVTERGGGSTWAENSYFFRLTPWHNDPVGDPVSEVIYLQDEKTGELWSATPGPMDVDAFSVRHAPGTSAFSHQHDDIASKLTLGIAPDAAVKLSVLRLTNSGSQARRLRITTYVEWTLGVLREHTQHQVHTRFDRERELLLAANYFDQHFSRWTAFHAISEPISAYTAGRRDFIGRNLSVANPAALLDGGNLSGVTGAATDPCAALQCEVELEPGETR